MGRSIPGRGNSKYNGSETSVRKIRRPVWRGSVSREEGRRTERQMDGEQRALCTARTLTFTLSEIENPWGFQ